MITLPSWRSLTITVAIAALASGCENDSSEQPDSGPADTGIADRAVEAAPAACTPANGKATVVSFSTEDGVKLEADLYLSGAASGPAAVLLHEIPPSNDRSNYPAAFIEALTSRGVTVLNVDRRGAGGSEGEATEAYTGPEGKLDAVAAYTFLKGHDCPMDVKRIVLIGASNGSTTALDFTVHASTESALELPRALVFLSGGTYTEAQNKIADHRTLLDQLPIQFVYSDTEVTWSESFQAGKAEPWQFNRYDGGDHGTGMFAKKPESIDDVAGFVAQAVKP